MISTSDAHGPGTTIGPDGPDVVYLTIRTAASADDALMGMAGSIVGMKMLHEIVVTEGVGVTPHALAVGDAVDK